MRAQFLVGDRSEAISKEHRVRDTTGINEDNTVVGVGFGRTS